MTAERREWVLCLDAMGVIYAAGDDVAELLIPFIMEKGGARDGDLIEKRYIDASLGHIDADAFWHALGVDPQLEDEYLARHTLSDGLPAFLEGVVQEAARVFCLSNDVARWSKKLRTRFGLEPAIEEWIISSEVHSRKPSRAIYAEALNRAEMAPERIVLVDDREKNLDVAHEIGFATVLFDPKGNTTASPHQTAKSFAELRDIWERLLRNASAGGSG